jgi:hypothetical protein
MLANPTRVGHAQRADEPLRRPAFLGRDRARDRVLHPCITARPKHREHDRRRRPVGTAGDDRPVLLDGRAEPSLGEQNPAETVACPRVGDRSDVPSEDVAKNAARDAGLSRAQQGVTHDRCARLPGLLVLCRCARPRSSRAGGPFGTVHRRSTSTSQGFSTLPGAKGSSGAGDAGPRSGSRVFSSSR